MNKHQCYSTKMSGNHKCLCFDSGKTQGARQNKVKMKKHIEEVMDNLIAVVQRPVTISNMNHQMYKDAVMKYRKQLLELILLRKKQLLEGK